MSVATLYARAASGLAAPLVTVETHLSNGLPKFQIVGLAETSLKESKDRVRSAIINSGFSFPLKHITVNLAPADLPKDGGRFDLAIALSILIASGQVPASAAAVAEYEFAGELGLFGDLRGFAGILPWAVAAAKQHKKIVLPKILLSEASLCNSLLCLPANHLKDVCAHFLGHPLTETRTEPYIAQRAKMPDMRDVLGQPQARRALELAATGGHSMLMSGPPGTGKTMLASRLPSLLPNLDNDEALEIASIASIGAAGFNAKHFGQRPFRAPHHTASAVSLVGGGTQPKPGEISLAHKGVLFLDELPEFSRKVLEVLREPLESGTVTVARAARTMTFPASFQLIAAMNPCPCGYATHPERICRCSPQQIERYRAKLSGPFLDRIDLHIEVPALPQSMLIQTPTALPEDSCTIRERVTRIQAMQKTRQGCLNGQLSPEGLRKFCMLGEAEKALLEKILVKLGLSARSYHKILKVARTVADMCGAENIQQAHLLEAIHFRKFDRPVLEPAPL